MATILQGSSDKQYDGGPEFAQVFVIVWIGAMVVTLNSKLLGGNMLVPTVNFMNFIILTYIYLRSFFQSVCVLGYCLAPATASLIVCRTILLMHQTKFLFFLRLMTALTGFIWSTYGE